MPNLHSLQNPALNSSFPTKKEKPCHENSCSDKDLEEFSWWTYVILVHPDPWQFR